MISRLVFALVAAAMFAASPAAAQKVWKTYKNERFGTSIEYPADKFIPQPPRNNSDGLRFIATDGAEFTVSAINNVLNQNLAALQASALKARPLDEKITHRERGPNWIVLSGTKANVIFYERHLLSHRGKIVNEFEILYPARLRGLYDPIVTRMSKSFHAGTGINTGPP
jgi:glutathione peroxidase-family protein